MATQTALRSPRNTTDESVLAAIHDSQEAVVDLAQKWTDSLGETVPELWHRPIAAGGPAIRDVTDAAFDLTRKLLDAQLEFARRIVGSLVEETKKLA
jgi:hypothetical protein